MTMLARRLQALFAAAMLAAPVVAHAQRQNSDAAPQSPDAERAAFKVADGFDVTLYAAEPMLLKPIGINFDAHGRLWVAGSQTYPQLKPGDAPQDKIFVLEDTDNDGKADKSTVFADGLFIATSVEIGDGGAYVANSTELLHLKDTDGDGKADQKRVVLSGFGTEDTHHVIHGFRWDYGGRLNFLQGIYIGSRVETPRGTKIGLASTLWQFRPESIDLGIYCQGLVNPWGVTWDRYGQMFLTDGAGGEGVNFAPPGAQFTAADGAKRVLKGLNPGSPKYCGAEIIDGRLFPAEWQGNLITNDFRANRTVRFALSDDGSGFSAKLAGDVITSTDRAYRPIDLKMGPDGALYVADWYNPIINHGEVDFRDPRRDKAHGRIWRIAPKGSKPLPRPKLVGATPEELLQLLEAPEQWTRLQAKLQLRAAGAKAVQPALAAWVKQIEANKELGALPREQLLLEALWTYESIDVPEPALLAAVAKAQTPNVRAAAVRVASHWARRVPAQELVVAAVADENPRVRLEAVRGLADIAKVHNDLTVLPAILVATDKPIDPVIDFAIFQALTHLKDQWLPLATSGKLTFVKPEHQTAALRIVQSGEAVKKAVADLKAGKLSGDKRVEAFDLIAAIGDANDVSLLLDQAADAKQNVDVRAAAATALERAARDRKLKPAGRTAPRVGALLNDGSPALQSIAGRLAGYFQNGELQQALEQKLDGPNVSADVRQSAAQGLAGIGGPAIPRLKAFALDGKSADTRAAAIAALARVDLKSAADMAAAYLTTARPGDDPAPVLGAFLKREGGVDALGSALKDKKLPADTAKLSLRYVQGVGVEIGALGEIIRTSAGAGAGGAVQLSPADMKALLDEVASKGDADRGETVYRSKAAGCVQCHMIGGAGGPLAPDLRAIGVSSPMDYIVDAILIPAKAVKDGYASTSVSTKDGDLIQGIKVREDSKVLVLRDNARDEIEVPLSEIKKRVEGGSLMPAGLQDGLTRQELVDLLKFMGELGKPGPYAVSPAPVVRRWRAMDPISDEAAASTAAPSADAAGWWPAYTKVSGELPLAELPRGKGVAYVRFELESAAGGSAKLTFNNAKGLTAWANGQPVAFSGNEAAITAAKGITTVTLKVDTAARAGEPIVVNVSAEGTTKVAPVLGR